MFFKLFQRLNHQKNFPYFICTPLIYGIGAASEHIFMASAYAKNKNKKLLIVKINILKRLLKYNICNNALFDSLIINGKSQDKRNFLYRIISFLINMEFALRRFLAILFKNFFKINLNETFRFAHIGTLDFFTEQKNVPYEDIVPLYDDNQKIELKADDLERCKNQFKNYNPENKKIVCLHVRDENYYKDRNRRSYRNSTIDNYIDLIKFLINKGYLVVRLGDVSSNKINFKNINFIDYPKASFRSEEMDLYLIQLCDFFIGTPSGPMDTAYLFNKPLLLTNLYDIYPSFLRKKIDRGLLRKIKRKDNGKVLSLKEFISKDINYHQTQVNIRDLQFIENSSTELLEAVQEFVQNLETFYYVNKEIEFNEKQLKLRILLNKRLEEIYNDEVIKKDCFKNDLWKKTHFLKIIKRFKSCKGTYTLTSLNSL